MKAKLVMLLIIVCGAVLAFLISVKISSYSKIIVIKNETTSAQSLLSNPALQQMTANIKGKVIKKNEDSFTVEYSGKIALLYIEPNGLSYFYRGSNLNNEIDFSQLREGDEIEGGVSVIVNPEATIGMSKSRKPGDFIAHNISVKSL